MSFYWLFVLFSFFFFNDTATTEIYTLSYTTLFRSHSAVTSSASVSGRGRRRPPSTGLRSEEHTSELQSHLNIVCRLLLEKNKKKKITITIYKKKKKKKK